MSLPLRDSDAEPIRRRLLKFYDGRRRDLPWRRDHDPYRVWVSEVMLQQTRVEAVRPYYERWIERFPTLDALADAELDSVLEAWAGLGYYARARNLHAAARLVRDHLDGELPRTAEGLRALPGVGRYTAGAVASIAFGLPEPAVDGNARRVLARLCDMADPPAADLERLARALVPERRPGDFNQALMELGATVCTARDPDCVECPLSTACRARQRGTVAARPGRRRRDAVPSYDVGTAVLWAPDGRTLLVRRSTDGLLGGLWEFPGRVAEDGETPVEAARRAAEGALGRPAGAGGPRLARVEHVYSHRRHAYHAFRFDVERAEPAAARGGWTGAAWIDPATLEGFAVSAAQRRIAGALATATC